MSEKTFSVHWFWSAGIVWLLSGLMTYGQTAGTASNSIASLDELRKQFETTIREVQRQAQATAQVRQQAYVASLNSLEESLQAAGNQLPAILAVRAEKARFEQSGEIPVNVISASLPALEKLQRAWCAQNANVPREQAQKIVAASEHYLQNLANLQKFRAAQNDTAGVEEVKAEKERLLSNNRIREALALLPETPADTAKSDPATPPPVTPPKTIVAGAALELGDYKFYPPGKETRVRNLQPLRMEFPSADRRSTQFFYELRIGLMTDKSAYLVESATVSYKSKSGRISNTPRITIASKNREIPEGCKMIVEYFSQPASRGGEPRCEIVEHIPLPPVPRGQAYTVDAKGITLSKSETSRFSHTSSERSATGRDFYGLIVSVFDAENKLLFQQCSSTALAAHAGSKPVEATSE